MKQLTILLIAASLLSSCAFQMGNISAGNADKNLVYNDIAIGTARTHKVFLIGGMRRDALVLEAKNAMMRNRPLQPNEFYTHMTVDFKTSIFLPWMATKATVTADVVRPAVGDEAAFSPTYRALIGQAGTTSLFAVGDSVIVHKSKGLIVNIPKKGKVEILFEKNGKMRTLTLCSNKVFATQKAYKGVKPGDWFDYEQQLGKETSVKVGQVVGVGETKFLVLNKNSNTFKAIQYPAGK